MLQYYIQVIRLVIKMIPRNDVVTGMKFVISMCITVKSTVLQHVQSDFTLYRLRSSLLQYQLKAWVYVNSIIHKHSPGPRTLTIKVINNHFLNIFNALAMLFYITGITGKTNILKSFPDTGCSMSSYCTMCNGIFEYDLIHVRLSRCNL